MCLPRNSKISHTHVMTRSDSPITSLPPLQRSSSFFSYFSSSQTVAAIRLVMAARPLGSRGQFVTLLRDAHGLWGLCALRSNQNKSFPVLRKAVFFVFFANSFFARNTSPGYEASFFNFGRQAHAPRVGCGPRACAVMYRRPSCVPMRKNREKRLTYAGEICPEAQKQAKWYIYIQGSPRDVVGLYGEPIG